MPPSSPFSPLRNPLRPSIAVPRLSKSNIFPVAKSKPPANTPFNPCGFFSSSLLKSGFIGVGSFSFSCVSPPDVGVITILPLSSMFNTALGDKPPMTSSCGSTLDSVVGSNSSSVFLAPPVSSSSFSSFGGFRLRLAPFSIRLSSVWNLSMISLNLSPSILSSPFFFLSLFFTAPKAFPTSVPPAMRAPAPKAILPPTAATPIAAGAALKAIANNPTFAIFFIKPLKNPPPPPLGFALAILVIRSTIIPLASFKNSKFLCREFFNPPKPDAKLFNEFNPPSNIFPRRALGSN